MQQSRQVLHHSRRSDAGKRCADIAPVEMFTNMCVIDIDQNARVRNASLTVKS